MSGTPLDRADKRFANVIWQARKWGTYPNGHVKLQYPEVKGRKRTRYIAVYVEPGDGQSYGLRIERKLARLLAKRINQCLDQT